MKKITTIYEDADVLVIDKPAGYLSHPDEKSSGTSVSEWFEKKYPGSHEVGDAGRPGIVHRLDKDTSGVMILAKTPEAYLWLKEQFESRESEKTYLAISHGILRDDHGMIDRPIGRSTHDARLRRTGRDADGKQREALTYYKVLERFNTGGGQNDGYTFFEVHPKTGRTHQVRVHLKSIGKPILCDALYAPGKHCLPEMGRQALHASVLELVLPQGLRKRFEAPLPDDFMQTLEKLRSLC